MTTTEHQTSRRLRRLFAVIAALGVVASLGAAAMATRSKTPPEHEATAEPRTATVTRGDLVSDETLAGTVEVADQIEVVHRIDEDSVGSGTSPSTRDAAPVAAIVPSIGAGLAVVLEQVACPVTTPTSDPVLAPTSDPMTTPTSEPVAASPSDSGATSIPESPTPTSGPVTTEVEDPACDTATSQQPVERPLDQPQPTPQSTPSGEARSPVGAGASTGVSPTTEFERVTSIVARGTQVALGDVIYTVEGAPVLAMSGETPAWRDLSETSDDGIDILQLERSLAELGYDDDGELSIDEEFDSNTSNAIEDWQNGLGLEPTGDVTLGDLVFLPETALVSAVNVTVGDQVTDGDAILTLDASRTQVTAIVPEELQSTVTVGMVVGLGEIDGTVERLVSEQGETTIDVKAIVVPIGRLEAAPGTSVTVRATTVLATDSLVVPAASIFSRIDGTYAVRTVDADATDWIPIVAVAEADGDVAIQTDQLSDGDQILLPG